MRNRLACAAIFLVIVFPASAQTSQMTCNHPVHAAPSPQALAARQAMRQACAADVAAFCSNVAAGCGMRRQCLMARGAHLSPGCQSALSAMRTAR